MAGPIAVGGVGGSGTRVVAKLLLGLGYDLGNDCNRALDDLWFNLLFYRPAWVRSVASGTADDQSVGLDLMRKRAMGIHRLTVQELAFIKRAWRDVARHGHFGRSNRRGGRASARWTARRVARFLRSGARAADAPRSSWGWKEPLSHLFAAEVLDHDPDARYVHVIRHGLDMAFSPNHRQVQHFGAVFGLDAGPGTPTPSDLLRYWIRANRRVADVVGPAAPARVHILVFDDLCLNPRQEVARLIEFLGDDVGRQIRRELCDLPRPPASVGRRRSHDLAALDAADIAEVARLGFTV